MEKLLSLSIATVCNITKKWELPTEILAYFIQHKIFFISFRKAVDIRLTGNNKGITESLHEK